MGRGRGPGEAGDGAQGQEGKSWKNPKFTDGQTTGGAAEDPTQRVPSSHPPPTLQLPFHCPAGLHQSCHSSCSHGRVGAPAEPLLEAQRALARQLRREGGRARDAGTPFWAVNGPKLTEKEKTQ